MIYQTEIEVTSSMLAPFVRCSLNKKPSFSFPVAFSSDLKNIVFPGCAARTTSKNNYPSTELSSMQQTECQTLDLSPNMEWRYRIPPQLMFDSFKPDYALQVSNSGEYLLTIHISLGLVAISPRHGVKLWLLNVYRDIRLRSCTKPNYSYIATAIFKEPFNAKENEANDFVTIHPHLPIIAFAHGGTILKRAGKILERKMGAALWNFLQPG